MLQRDADGTPTPDLKIRLSDYQPSAWRITSVELVFDLGIASTEVYARLELESASATPTPLRLDGEGLELIELRLNGKRLGPLGYRVEAHALELSDLPASCALESRVRIRPQANTALEGLYLSGSAERGFLLTQCEAQGFRHITWFLDRPDVLTRYSVELR
ncbi:MAG: aminopeptidase N, partial [Pseudomonadota bacterium]|nr:aminopeptidase N [Pseudomonadota bacterium]